MLRKWSNESMLKAVRSGAMGANRAVRMYTLEDRLSGRVKHGTNPGPFPYLTSNEEADLLSRVRANAVTEENMKTYFDLAREDFDRPWSTEQTSVYLQRG